MPASFSVLSPSEIVHCSGIFGLTMRHPSVVECMVCEPGGKPFSGFKTTQGARLIDSTPPTRIRSASPVSIARLAWIAASRLRPPRGGVCCAGARGVEARAAEAVDRRAGDARRQPGQEHGHARDVTVVLARAVGVAEHH